MSKAVLISINPEWCDFIKLGTKTVEVRKSRPKLNVPFKVYIYCTIHGCSFLVGRKHPLSGNGMVVGEFICNKIEVLDPNQVFDADAVFSSTCLTSKQIIEYSDIGHEELALRKRELKLKEKAASEGDNAALAKLDEVLGKIEGGF
ncbi:MAG: ASCH domain-containing protein [Huintestinicola sp.]